SFIDRLTHVTVGAGMVTEPHLPASTSAAQYSAFALELNQLLRKHFPHWDARDLLGGKYWPSMTKTSSGMPTL
ncbi:hypothetical protein Q6292_28425, partial [Klebsiella pneumoniae]|nr:hypothetical protein [Klebsiella pneumoniae]